MARNTKKKSKRSTKRKKKGKDLPAKVDNKPTGLQVTQSCEIHPDITFKVGGFCEKCYGDDTRDRIMALDKKLDEKVLARVEEIIDTIMQEGDPELLERFFGKILKRFGRPDVRRIDKRVTRVNLSGPVDYGR